ncbi:MAG: 1-acyl-sn-glycerol-3-phosphate acyltransferase [Myxococcaceae bacterium]|nr:1-acyl-sn-glycerol-3-phosphate acyltransferase [Myxococcaceae bacterium]
MSRWFAEKVGHRYGNDPNAYDSSFIGDVEKVVGRLYGPGRYFELTLRGLDDLPPSPAMLVSNHSGGTTIPDVWGMGIAWHRKFGGSRRLYLLAHELLFAVPQAAQFFERVGALRANLDNAKRVLAAGHDVLVFPGGDLDTWRPYTKRYQVDFHGRCGFARLAKEVGVPVVPVAHAGAHEGLRVLTSGRFLARAVGLHKVARAEIWPIHLSLPWGIALGPLPHIPLPGHFRYLLGSALWPRNDEGAEELALRVQGAIQLQLQTLELEAGR